MNQKLFNDRLLEHFRPLAAGARLPRSIRLVQGRTADELLIELPARSMQQNMQADAAAFEAWALLAHVHCGVSVVLAVQPLPDQLPYTGHTGRFLYRAMKFSEQFAGWFSLSPALGDAVGAFREYLACHRFCNNVPTGPAGENAHLENRLEALFAGPHAQVLQAIGAKKGLYLDGPFFRQLPVGLFEETASKQTGVFTGGKSAIDLWTTAGEDLVFFELKVDNAKVGILSEVMFYANYLADMFVAHTFVPQAPPDDNKDHRGYARLFDRPLRRVRAVLLTDRLHPLLTATVLQEMDQGSPQIRYHDLRYALDLVPMEGGA